MARANVRAGKRTSLLKRFATPEVMIWVAVASIVFSVVGPVLLSDKRESWLENCAAARPLVDCKRDAEELFQ